MPVANAKPSDATVLSSSARTATPTVEEFTTGEMEARGMIATLVASAAGSSPSTVLTLEMFDVASATWVALLASAAITGTGTTQIACYPGAGEVANEQIGLRLPRRWRVRPVHGNGTTHTYTLGVAFLP